MIDVTCRYCGDLGYTSTEEAAQERLDKHAEKCPGLKPEEVERAKQYLICQQRGHKPSSIMTASNPPQNICSFCGTYYWTTTVTTLHEGMRKPSEAAIEAAQL